MYNCNKESEHYGRKDDTIKILDTLVNHILDKKFNIGNIEIALINSIEAEELQLKEFLLNKFCFASFDSLDKTRYI